MGNKNADTIIVAYEQANADATEMLKYLGNISSPAQLEDGKLPSLVKNLENTSTIASQNYINGASIVGGSVAVAVSTSISSSAFARGIGFAALGGGGVAGAIGAVVVPMLGWFAVPVIAGHITIKLISDAKVKKYIKNNNSTLKSNQKGIEKEKKKLLQWFVELQEQIANIDKELKRNIEEKYDEYKEKAKKLSKNVSIQIDDCVNKNTNKRILQYNEVIINQYRLQKELEDKVEYMFEEYNKLLETKLELERQVYCLIKLLNAIGCPESVINQALNESGGKK